VQVYVVYYLSSDLTDILFCGDIVRHITFEPGKLKQFFKKEGRDTHSKYKDLWDGQFTDEANAEIDFEYNREYPSHFNPSCDDDSIEKLLAQDRIKFYLDPKCTQEITKDSVNE
jgi:hypothetical protein